MILDLTPYVSYLELWVVVLSLGSGTPENA
jgi:hypothetical protein